MSTQVEINDFIAVLMEQRNSALNSLAEASATVASLKRQIEGVTQNETDTEDTNT